MEIIWEIIKVTLPALTVIWAVYIVLQKQNEQRKNESVPQKEDKKIILSIRLKAYERLTLFMERISPEKLVQRQLKKGMTCGQLQMDLLRTIRNEYEHNLTQQLYISNEAWQTILLAKESIIQLINTSMTAVKAETPAFELSRIIIETYNSADTTPTEVAIGQLKKEVINSLS